MKHTFGNLSFLYLESLIISLEVLDQMRRRSAIFSYLVIPFSRIEEKYNHIWTTESPFIKKTACTHRILKCSLLTMYLRTVLPPKSNFRNLQFWGILLIFLLAVHINTAIYLGRIKIIFQFYSIDFPHLLGIIGASFIAIFTPIFYILKRRKPKQYKLLISLHMFGNVTSFLLSSMHVVFRLLRFPLGIGFILFILTSLLTISGFVSKFNLLKPRAQSLSEIISLDWMLEVLFDALVLRELFLP